MSDTPETDDPMIAALLRERAGYVGRKGKEDRVAAVDEQLRLRGYKAARRGQKPATVEPKDPQTEQPQDRKAPTKSET